jgi:hypothetical protein
MNPVFKEFVQQLLVIIGKTVAGDYESLEQFVGALEKVTGAIRVKLAHQSVRDDRYKY